MRGWNLRQRKKHRWSMDAAREFDGKAQKASTVAHTQVG